MDNKIEIIDINALYTKSENNAMIKSTEHVVELSELPTLETLLEMATVIMNWNADEGRFRSVIHFTWKKNTKDTELYYLSLYELQDNLETIGYDASGDVILNGYKMSISWGNL